MAREELLHQIWTNEVCDVVQESDIDSISDNKSIIVQSGNKELRQKVISKLANKQDYVIFVKNIEVYDNSLFKSIGMQQKLILSWNVDACDYKEKIIQKNRDSKIVFTPLELLAAKIPNLEKYESYFISKHQNGILRMEKE